MLRVDPRVGQAALVALFAGSACRERDTAGEIRPQRAAASAPTASAKNQSEAPIPSRASPAKKRGPDVARPTARLEQGTGPFVIDEPVPVGPAGPATPHDLGVVMIDRRDGVVIARRGKAASGERSAATAVSALNRKREDFVAYARGPALVGDFAYWVRRGELVRARIDGTGGSEVLASDARNGTRVSGSRGPQGALIAYITTPNAQGALRARLWVEGGPSLALTPEGAGTSSVAWVAKKNGWMVLSLDGRSGMTPLHARSVTADSAGVQLAPDIVIWVGTSAQATTEVFGAATEDDVWAFIPIERDMTHFGLAQIPVGAEPHLDTPATFATYPNGLNTAPAAAASLCGRTVVAFAQPIDAKPNAAQELILSTVGSDGLAGGEVVATARSFADASLAVVPNGGLLVYNAEHRTWALSLRCRRSAAKKPG